MENIDKPAIEMREQKLGVWIRKHQGAILLSPGDKMAWLVMLSHSSSKSRSI